MSIGDIIRLNRMYKCGLPYLNNMPQIIKGTTDLPSSEKTIKPYISNNRTIFGVLVFKAVEQT